MSEVKVIRDSSHSTDAQTIDHSVWELVFQTDENYWSVGMFIDESIAQYVAKQGNAFLDPEDITKRETGFQIREHKVVLAIHRDWTRQDFIDEIDGWEVEDWFLPEVDPEEPS